MHRLFPRLLLAGALLFSTGAWAKSDVDKQIALLRTSEDFRVRTQAALSLGASHDKRALVPLCHGLGDTNRTVRIAAASGIARLNLGGKACLERRLEAEKDAKVKASIRRALDQLAGGGAEEAGPVIDGSTKYYIALGPASKKPEVAGAVRSAMAKQAGELDGYAVAPKAETAAEARKVLAKYEGVKAFYLAPKVQKRYSDGNLTVKISVAMLTYPDKAVLGQFSVKLTQQGVSEPDPEAEKELIALAAESAMQKFAQTAHRLGS